MADYLLLDFRSTVPREQHPRKYCGIAHDIIIVVYFDMEVVAIDRLIREFRIPRGLLQMFKENFRRISVRSRLLQIEATFVLAECR